MSLPKPSLAVLYDAAMNAIRTGVYCPNATEGPFKPNHSIVMDPYETAMRKLQGYRYRGEGAPMERPEGRGVKASVPFSAL
jgi:hypothetical protein